ncbi:ATP-dependent metallopeptidase FtsH/Yme1/Tma family protein [Deinococcus sp. NW-56]|uniref:ATP-dependent metallopeptidase FtsH/Yme1/Tma family protein n=1 Tax=Deinococcus sp. NW-56 TaxID=2080419 RepID=UPI000CF45072|nr:ATP-dependent metallopeptidase FtsH/Yme1/Tma family protein [Deinococcus sp. NW-56]
MPLPRLARLLAFALPLLVFALFGLWLLRTAFSASPTVPYAEFTRLLEAGRVERVVVRGERAEVTLAPPEVGRVAVRLPSTQATSGPTLISQLERQGVDYRFEAPGQWLAIGLNFLPILLVLLLPLALFAALLVVLVRRGRSRTP